MLVLLVVIIGLIMLATGTSFHGALGILPTILAVIALALVAFIFLRMQRVVGRLTSSNRRASAGNHEGHGNGFRKKQKARPSSFPRRTGG